MRSSQELIDLFMSDLKKYNPTNFKTIARADLSKQDATVHKAFSSVVTRYFIFKERHPEVDDVEHNILYFKLKLDLVARYFSEYPDTTTAPLVAFQLELRNYLKDTKTKLEDIEDDKSKSAATVQDIPVVTGDPLPVKQQ